MALTLNDLIDHLQMLRDELDNSGLDSLDPVVQMHYQPNYPLRSDMKLPTFLVEAPRHHNATDNPIITVAMVDGGQCYDNPYGNRAAWDQGNDLNYLLAEFERENEKDDEEE